MKRLGLVFAFATLPVAAGLFAQSNPGQIHGKIYEKKNLPAIAVLVWVDVNGSPFKVQTDDEGRYAINPLDAGTYIMHFDYEGDTFNLEVVVNSNEITVMKDIDMASGEFKINETGEVEVRGYWDPLIHVDQPNMAIVSAKELAHSPAKRNIKSIMESMTSAVKVDDNGDAYVRGSRADAVIYYIDGVKLTDGFKSPPASAISTVAMYTGGVPAKYGDCLSGVVVVETKNYFSLYNEWKAKQTNK